MHDCLCSSAVFHTLLQHGRIPAAVWGNTAYANINGVMTHVYETFRSVNSASSTDPYSITLHRLPPSSATHSLPSAHGQPLDPLSPCSLHALMYTLPISGVGRGHLVCINVNLSPFPLCSCPPNLFLAVGKRRQCELAAAEACARVCSPEEFKAVC